MDRMRRANGEEPFAVDRMANYPDLRVSLGKLLPRTEGPRGLAVAGAFYFYTPTTLNTLNELTSKFTRCS